MRLRIIVFWRNRMSTLCDVICVHRIRGVRGMPFHGTMQSCRTTLIVRTHFKVTCKCLVHVDPLSRSNFCENNLAVMSVSIPLTWDKHRNIALLYFGAPNGNKSFWKINTASDCSQIVSTNSDKLQLVLIVLYLCVRKCFAKCGRGKAVYELSRDCFI